MLLRDKNCLFQESFYVSCSFCLFGVARIGLSPRVWSCDSCLLGWRYFCERQGVSDAESAQIHPPSSQYHFAPHLSPSRRHCAARCCCLHRPATIALSVVAECRFSRWPCC